MAVGRIKRGDLRREHSDCAIKRCVLTACPKIPTKVRMPQGTNRRTMLTSIDACVDHCAWKDVGGGCKNLHLFLLVLSGMVVNRWWP